MVTHPTQQSGPIAGFRFLWAFYVNGYDPDKQCQPCFRGQRVADFSTATACVGHPVLLNRMDRYPFVYICGVSSGLRVLRRERNLHLPLAHAEGQVVDVTTYNGYRVQIDNARVLDVPALPSGWHGRPEAQVRCRNYQFAVAYFGAPPCMDSGSPHDGPDQRRV